MSVLYLMRGLQHVLERLDHLCFEAAVDFVFLPEVAVAILDPLEVRGGDAAGVGEDVGDDEHAALVQVLVRLRRRRAVGPLGDDLRLDLAGRSPS